MFSNSLQEVEVSEGEEEEEEEEGEYNGSEQAILNDNYIENESGHEVSITQSLLINPLNR